MELLKVVGVGILISFIVTLVKQVKPELAVATLVAGVIVMLIFILQYFTDILSVLNSIVSKTGIDNELFSTVLKIVAVGYLIEFGANICNDTGNSSIGDKVILGGKLLILILSLPILTSLLDIVIGLVPWKKQEKYLYYLRY